MDELNRLSFPEERKNLFINALNNNVFSGAALGVSVATATGFQRAMECYGYTESENKKNRVTQKTFFDLASLTKPLVTVLSLLALLENKTLGWHDNLGSLLEKTVDEEKKTIQLHHLMAHNGGLVAHKPYFKELLLLPDKKRRQALLQAVLHTPINRQPGKEHLYSDLGYILLGYILEQKTAIPLDELWKKVIAQPLHLEKKCLFPKKNQFDAENCAQTGSCPWSHATLQGVVHDDNSRAVGGVTGHAGLFGTLEGVVILCEQLMRHWQGKATALPFSTELLKMATKKKNNSNWTAGFDTPSAIGSSSGRFFSHQSIGHLGFTGTSFWMDLSRGICITLLTNRTCCQENAYEIKKFRPRIHNMIMEKLV